MLTAENIAQKSFRRTLFGYDLEQVDGYLDKIILQLQQLEKERQEMAGTIEYLSEELRKATALKGGGEAGELDHVG